MSLLSRFLDDRTVRNSCAPGPCVLIKCDHVNGFDLPDTITCKGCEYVKTVIHKSRQPGHANYALTEKAYHKLANTVSPGADYLPRVELIRLL